MLAQQLSQTEHPIGRPRDNDLHTPTSLDCRERDQQMRDGSTDEPGSTTRTSTSAMDNHNADDWASPASSLRSMRDEHLDGDGDAGWWLAVPEQVLTDLVHLFFDKIQAWLPLLHRPRFFDRYMKNGVFDKRSPQSFSDIESLLLCGVLALAARHSLSPWFQDIPASDRGQRFADDANRYYEMARPSDQGPTLEYLQGCILLAFYQYASGPSHHAWVLAGVCVRLAYDLNLCNMDEQQDNWEDSKDWSYSEEQRRAFWLVWEVDTFGSIMSRRPSSINRSMMAVRLPVRDAAWFADKPVKSPVIDPRPSEVWKILLDSPNQDERAWFLVANLLMTVAGEFAAGRHTCQRDKDEVVDAITCFSLVISQRFNLETLEFSDISNDAARYNWVIGIHLMLTCARATIQASFTAKRPGVLSLPRHMSRILYQWHPEYITLSQPFLACCLLSDRAYPSEETMQAPDTPYHSMEMVNLVLSQYASVWKLASVLLDLRASLIRRDHPSADASFGKRFALYFPCVSPGRSKNHKDGQSSLMSGNFGEEIRDDSRVVDENGSGRVGLQQLSQTSGELKDAEAAMVELANMPGRELSKVVHLDSQNDWNTRLWLDYVCDDNQEFNYLEL
ncbi:fungal-specific transcription factor domain-containing protein [Dactylonectria estremocensis]|uniref:Fungal-specific transcription factor domain-containing protein n=1 Tax=Dactylonectria estremocensis TaxID=1079267 RepID=A0A9P9ERZ2_9HYPO|nr:fungal-specific transcription factor domain-containing protein [Dactylonectria estremocensis]